MAKAGTDSRSTILRTARQIIAEEGTRALTFDAVARRLGVTKQAIIYWFPSKQVLLGELVLPWIQAEAERVVAAVEGAPDPRQGITRAVHALVDFHLEDLDRFRQMYLAVQLDPKPHLLMDGDTLRSHVHPTTGRMYAALARMLAGPPPLHPALAGEGAARRAAVALHMAALGLILMVALGAAVDDPLAHGTDALVASLIALVGGDEGEGR